MLSPCLALCLTPVGLSLLGLTIVTTTALDGQSAAAVTGTELNWAGTYVVAASLPMADPRDPSGTKWEVSTPTPLVQTDQIVARLGVRFGVGFTIQGTPVGAPVTVRRVWHFPPTTNPTTGQTLARAENSFICRLGVSCFTGQFLSESFELVEGPWRVEVWVNETKVLEHAFTLEHLKPFLRF